jgi:hypothetical protein
MTAAKSLTVNYAEKSFITLATDEQKRNEKNTTEQTGK